MLAVCVFVLVGLSSTARAHDVPSELRVHAFVKPEGERLHVLLRIPLALLLNIDLAKRGPGYLELAQIDEGLARAVAATERDVELYEEGRRLLLVRGEARISLPSDRSFESFDKARALIAGPRLAPSTDVFWNQGYFDAHLEYAIPSAASSFALDFHVSRGLRDRLKLEVRYVTRDGTVRAYEVPTGSGPVMLDPHWYEAAWTFTRSGFEHILDGADHLLFLLCLILPFRRIDWRLVGVVTAFTVGHSITLIAAANGVVPSGDWFPPLVETLIAASILYMAAENIVRPNLKRRWLVSGLFGLIHGFGFSFALSSELQFAGAHLLVSLLAFNVGIELGQLLVLVIAWPVLALIYRMGLKAERLIVIVASALVAHTAWHWMGERIESLRKANLPSIEKIALPEVALFVALAAILAGITWRLARVARGRFSGPQSKV